MLTVYGNTNCMNIPLVGLFDQEHGDAMMLQIESLLDANVRLSRKDGLIWPESVWQCSMGKFAYPRRATYRFIDQGGYVKMAEIYREYQKKRGMLKTLAEKAKERPAVSFDRKTDLKNKRDVFQYYLQKGLVIGTEHGNDWGADLVDYTEGGLSGSNWWIPGKNTSGWNAGHLRAPVSRDDFSPEYLKYGLPTQRIPFWELVYHDCVATTWYCGDSAGWFWKVAPEIKTMKDRITLLYGDMPLLWSDVKFDWKNDSAEHLETYYLTVPSMRDKFGVRMTSHEFLTDDLQVQKTTFANGSETVVNFGGKTFEYKGEHLPQNGFHCTGPNLQQRRVLRDGKVITWVKTDEFFYCDSPSPIKDLPLSISGRIVLFKMDDTQWNLVLTGAASEPVELSAAALAGYIGKKRFRVAGFDEGWNRTEPRARMGKTSTFGKKVYALTD